MQVPTIKTITKQGIERNDLISYHFNRREIYLFEEITDEVARNIILQLNYLNEQSHEDITIWINSPGGSVTAGFAIYDAMKRCECDIITICTGISASMAAFLLSAGTKGKRYATPQSEIMLHQPLGDVQGKATDIDVVAKRIIQTKKRINIILAQTTGLSIKKIVHDCEHDFYLLTDEAIRYGIIDNIY